MRMDIPAPATRLRTCLRVVCKRDESAEKIGAFALRIPWTPDAPEGYGARPTSRKASPTFLLGAPPCSETSMCTMRAMELTNSITSSCSTSVASVNWRTSQKPKMAATCAAPPPRRPQGKRTGLLNRHARHYFISTACMFACLHKQAADNLLRIVWITSRNTSYKDESPTFCPGIMGLRSPLPSSLSAGAPPQRRRRQSRPPAASRSC